MQPFGCLFSHAARWLPDVGMDDVDDVFRALADPSRRMLLDSLNARNGQSLRELCAGLEMARQSVSKHLAVLEAADLVTTVRQRPREAALPQRRADQRHRRPLDQPATTACGPQALADLKTALEGDSMSQHQRLRLHHLHPDHAGAALAGDHRPGVHPALHGPRPGVGLAEGVDLRMGGAAVIEHAEQVILESDPFRRLAFTFHTFIPESRRTRR